MSLISDIRVDIGDDGATPTYSDAQIIALLQKAARRLNREFSLTGADAIAVDGAGALTTSDPNERLHDLLLLQTECLMAKRDFNSELNSGGAGLFVKDGEQVIDNRDSATSRQSFFNGPNSPCEELKRAITAYKLENTDGKLIW
jgi:hypothetical protein